MTAKRFIAGITCPQCQQLDKTVLYKHEGIEHTECVRCGYQQQQPQAASPHQNKPKEHIITFTNPQNKTKSFPQTSEAIIS